MGVCVPQKCDCPKCGGTDTVQLFEEEQGVTSFCFKCRTVYDVDETRGLLNGTEVRKAVQYSEQEIQAQIQGIIEAPVLDIPERGLTLDTAKYFQVRTGLSEQDGRTRNTWHFPLTKVRDGKRYLAGYKTRLIQEKRMWSTRGCSDAEMFGWSKAERDGGKTLYICEGEFDAMTVHQVLLDNAKQRGYQKLFSVVSLPTGAQSAKAAVSRHVKDIARIFKEVRLVFDQDEAGQKAEKEAVLALEGESVQVYVCKLPYKDANEALMKNDTDAILKACVFEKQEADSGSLVNSDTLWDKAEERPVMGEPWPWDGLTKLTKGIRDGEVWYFGAAPKLGKSVVVDQLGAWFIKNGSVPVYFCKPEEQTHHTLQRLAGKAVQRVFHDPDIPWDATAFNEGKRIIGDKAFLEDVYAMSRWDDVKRSIRRCSNQFGVRRFFIDPLTTFTSHMDAAKANEELQRIASELAALMKEVQGTAFVFCHLKAKAQGKSHSNGGRVLSDEFAGSRAMARYCHGMVGIEGNKDPDQPKGATNLRDLVLLEDRNFGQTGRIHLKYSHNTGCLTEITSDEHIKIKEGLLDEE